MQTLDTSRVLPPGCEFAFTILDDTDDGTVENSEPFYALLQSLGIRTTKTVWPVECPEGSRNFFAGETLEDEAYLAWVRELQSAGFEITWHGATRESSRRERTLTALDAFVQSLGRAPRIHVNHAQNKENMYWGANRYGNALLKWLYRVQQNESVAYEGERDGSAFFWGDVCRARMDYVRGFAFRSVDTLRHDPTLIYRLRRTPFVNAWFSTSDAPDAAAFTRLMTSGAIRELREGRGICILSTHIGKGFVADGQVVAPVERALREIAALPGWFVPVGTLLDKVKDALGGVVPYRSAVRQSLVEFRHVVDRMT